MNSSCRSQLEMRVTQSIYSRSKMFFKIGVLKNFTEKNLGWSLFLMPAIKACNFIKKRL